MKDLTPKVNSSQASDGKLTAEEFNDMRNDAQNAVIESGQTLTVDVGDDNRQLLKAIAVGGKRISRGTGETAEVGEIVLPDNSSAPVTITLPAIADLFVNAPVVFEQVTDQHYSTQALTIDRNSQLIMGLSENFTLDSDNSDNSIVEFVWAAGSIGWSVNLIGDVGFTVAPSIPVGTVIPNRAPTFPIAQRAINFTENAPGTAFIGNATDADGDALTYSISGTDSSYMNVVPTTGAVTFKTPPDYETKTRYSFFLRATDTNGRFASQVVTINIIDVNEVANQRPVFFPSKESVNFTENSTGVVFTANANDPDGDTLTYQIGVQNADDLYFNINSSTGALTFKTPPDYEVKSLYSIVIIASDENRAAFLELIVNIIDVNETGSNRPPVFAQSFPIVNFTENATGTVFISTATDPDGDALTYSISGTDSSYFNINPSTGVITFKTPPDYETKTSYLINSHATDGEYVASQAITINIMDVTETVSNRPPVFAQSTRIVNFTENATGNVFTVYATDPDNSTLTYALSGADASYFNINATFGVVTFKTPPDYETKTSYQVTAHVFDGQYGATQTITVNITNVNETVPNNPPVFAQTTQTVSFTENRTGTVFTAVASDADNDTLTYSISNSYDGSSFNINPSTGVVTFKTPPDYEAKNVYIVVALASDGTDIATLTVRVNINNANDAPVFYPASNTFYFAENNSGTVFTASDYATDVEGDILTYSLGGTHSGYFNINSSTGAVTFKIPPDYEVRNHYDLTVIASDGVNNTTFTATVNISNDPNENNKVDPVFPSAQRTISFTENRTGTVLTGDATDADGDTLTYSISGTDSSYMNVVPSTGVITFKSPPDYETKTRYYFFLRATDIDGGFASQVITINIIDSADDNPPAPIPPTFSVPSRSVSFAENATGTVFTVFATDPDTSVLTYSLTGADASYFNINPSHGVVTFKSPPDYETKTSYQVNAHAYDGRATATQVITVNITDVDETVPNRPPVFSQQSRTVSFTENTTGNVFTVYATDPDDSTLTYSLSGTDASYFNINATFGVVTFKSPPDYETKTSYQVTANVFDGQYSATQTITVNIIDVVETIPNRPPVFSQQSRTLSFTENATGTVIDVSSFVVDPDNDTLTYTLESTDASYFNINSLTGVVTFKSPPDYETKNAYTFRVRASDGEASAALSVRVNITDVTEAAPNRPPSFTPLTRTVNFTEMNTGVVFISTAIDPDGDTLVYSLSGTDAASFNINSTNGSVTFKSPPDYETKTSYQVNVHAFDGEYTATQIIRVNIIDVAEASNTRPVFLPTTRSVNFIEQQTGIVFTASANDPDGDTLTYGIAPQVLEGIYFNINASTGAVTFKSPPDYETRTSYRVAVVASDGELSATLLVTVNIIESNEGGNTVPFFDEVGRTILHTQGRYGPVVRVQANDDDGDTLTYSIEGAVASNFTIDPVTGIISFASNPVVQDSYQFIARASDGVNSDTQSIVIVIMIIPDPGFSTSDPSDPSAPPELL